MESGDPLACRKIGLFLFSLDLKLGKAIKDDEIVWKSISVFIHINEWWGESIKCIDLNQWSE